VNKIEKVKIQPLILIALLMSAINMLIQGYNSFKENEAVQGILFILVTLFFLGLIFFAMIRNRKIEHAREEKDIKNKG
jgi:integral membrane sensor domain MASE1